MYAFDELSVHNVVIARKRMNRLASLGETDPAHAQPTANNIVNRYVYTNISHANCMLMNALIN